MTQKQLIKKVKTLIKSDKIFINKLIDKAILSGCMDIENAENNFILPKNLLSAIYKQMSHEYSPLSGDKKNKKEVENIFLHL